MEERFDKRGFHIVKASAGSGKTYRLVRDYLACCLWEDQPLAFRHILAITFTNKAAQEMKDRILNDVREVAEGAGAMHASLLDIVPVDAETLERRARALSEAMMHRYEDFSVMTIDSFVNRLVRSFAKDLKWEEDFQIELDESALIEDAVARLLSRVGRPGEEALTGLLEGFVRQQVEEEANANFRAQLVKFGKQVTKENMQQALEALDPEIWTPAALEAYREREYRDIRAKRAIPRKLAQVALDGLIAAGLDDRDFSHGTVPKWLRKVAAGGGRSAGLGVRLEGQIEAGTYWKANASAALIEQIEGTLPAFDAAVEAWRALYSGPEGARFKLREHLQERVSLIGTLGLIRDELEAVQIERNVRLLSTLNQEISRIVRENPAPFIYERIGNRYRNIFIDEFQDTSITQWHNLVHLFEHLISLDEMGMVVGDGKQAIYRWRNGNYEQLQALPDLIGDPSPVLLDAATALKRAERPGNLNHNRRSGWSIVDWNNRWFQHIQGHLPEKLRDLYDDVTQDAVAEFSGQVHLDTAVESQTQERVDMRHRWVLDRILHHTGGRLVERNGRMQFESPASRGAGFELADIAVLMRRNRDGAALAQYLMEFGIAPWTSDSLHLGRHPVTLGVMALLRWTMDPKNPAPLLTFVQCYCAIHSDVAEADLLKRHRKELVIEREGQKPYRKAYLDARELFAEVVPDLRIWEQVTAPLSSMVGHCFEATGWGKLFPAYAEGMLELAHEASAQRRGTLKEFVSFWERTGQKRSIQVAGGAGAVQIMTPHKAKGLDFPVVIAPIHPENIDQFKDEIPVMLTNLDYELPVALLRNSDLKDTELEPEREAEIERTVVDALNVAYVTMTRAVERLDVLLEFASAPEPGKEMKTLPHVLWAGWQSAFPSLISESKPCIYGEADRKLKSTRKADESEEVHVPALVLGQAFDQKIARPKRHWSEWVASGSLGPRQFGTALHAVLGSLSCATEWPALHARMQRLDRDGSAHELAAVVERLVQHEGLKRFFEVEREGVFAERSLSLANGEVGRPDRVVCLDDGWHVLDFKTGKARPTHEIQVRAYCEAVAKIYPKHRVRGWLFYTESMELKEVHGPIEGN